MPNVFECPDHATPRLWRKRDLAGEGRKVGNINGTLMEYGGFHEWATQTAGWFHGKSENEMDEFGVPPF